MPPTWGKKPQSNNSSTGFPGIKHAKSKDEPAQKTQYEEIQEDELIALASIYGEDFRNIEKNQTAWKVCKFSPLIKPDLLIISRNPNHLLKFASNLQMRILQ